MNYNELNEYIKHYIEKDQTKSAIMLTGDWGTGKSYYIHNFLEPFLNEQENENDKHRCAIVSLYGLENISEISKRIYFELRSFSFSKKSKTNSARRKSKSEAFLTGGVGVKILAKTVLNGMTNMIGFDLGSIDDKDLEKVYSSIDLTNILVVFEDLERSNIDIIEILGYVNNLVEQDGAKVLLVVNENEILKYCDSQPDEDGKTHKIPDEKTEIYLKAKEKTISDTIIFNGDIVNAIRNIISSFNNTTLNMFISDKEINDIINIMSSQRNYNLRSFMYACQKTTDIFEKIFFLDSLEYYIIKSVFYGTIYLSLKIKNGKLPDIPFNSLLFKTVDLMKYPVYRFCYHFIKWQQFSIDEVQDTFSEHKRQRLYKQENFEEDHDLKIVFYYSIYSENAVRDAVNSIEHRLSVTNDIPLYSYDKLAYFLIKINTVLGIDYLMCQEMMIENIKNEKNMIDSNIFDWSLSSYSFDSGEEDQFIKFSKGITSALKPTSYSYSKFYFSYTLSEIEPLRKFVIDNKEQVRSDHKFLSDYEMPKLIEMILKCDSFNLNAFRNILQIVYKEANSDDFFTTDIAFMDDLKNKLEIYITQDYYLLSIDKIQLYQIKGLIEDLTQLIKQFPNT